MGHMLDTLIPDDGAVVLENYMWQKGWERRMGLLDVSEVPEVIGGEVIAAYVWERSNADSYFMVQTKSGKIFALNLTTQVWTGALTSGLTTVGSFASYSNAYVDATHGGDRVYWCNGVESFRSWDASGVMDLHTTAPRGRLLTVHADCMWMAYGRDPTGDTTTLREERVYKSEPGDPLTWEHTIPPGAPQLTFVDIGRPSDREITAIVSFFDMLIVFKSSQTYVIYDPVELANRLVDPSKGCVGERAWAINGTFMLFVTRDGIAQFDPSGPSTIVSTILGRHWSEAIDFRRQATTFEVQVCGYSCGACMGFGLGPSDADPDCKQFEWFPYAPGQPWVKQTRPSWLFGEHPHGISTIAAQGNEIQSFKVVGGNAGTFTLTFDGQTTVAVPFNPDAATVQAALEGLSNIAPGDVTVTRPGGVNQITRYFKPPVPYQLKWTNPAGVPNITAVISNTATAAQVQTALEGMGNIAPGDVIVTETAGDYRIEYTGSYKYTTVSVVELIGYTPTGGNVPGIINPATPSGDITVEFKGTYVGVNVPLLTIDTTALITETVPERQFIDIEGLQQNEVQRVVLTPSNSDWRLEFDGQTTFPITAAAPASNVQAWLESLSNINPGDVFVSKPAGQYEWHVEFMGQYSGQNVPNLTVTTYPYAWTVTTIQAAGLVGTFQLTFEGFTTTALASGASAAVVQAALEALANFAPGDIIVEDDHPNAWQFVFIGQYVATDVPFFTVSASLLGMTYTIQEVTKGHITHAGPLVAVAVQQGFTITIDTGHDELWTVEHGQPPVLVKHQPPMDTMGGQASDGTRGYDGTPIPFTSRFVTPWLTMDLPLQQKVIQYVRIIEGANGGSPDACTVRVDSERQTGHNRTYNSEVKRLNYDVHGYRHRLIFESVDLDHAIPFGMVVGHTEGMP